MKKVLAALMITALSLGLIGGANAAKSKAVQVFEDAVGDADTENDIANIPGGFDLVSGTIQKEGKDQLKFVVTHGDMPPTGSLGEGFRLIWGLTVGSTQYEMTIKSFDVGKPDVIASVMGQDPNGEERVGKVYQGVARFEECGTISLGINWSQCTALGYYDAVFDPAAKTVTWVVDMAVMKAKAGTVIAGGAGGRASTGCMICWVPQYAERSLTPTSIIDAATMTVSYKIPR